MFITSVACLALKRFIRYPDTDRSNRNGRNTEILNYYYSYWFFVWITYVVIRYSKKPHHYFRTLVIIGNYTALAFWKNYMFFFNIENTHSHCKFKNVLYSNHLGNFFLWPLGESVVFFSVSLQYRRVETLLWFKRTSVRFQKLRFTFSFKDVTIEPKFVGGGAIRVDPSPDQYARTHPLPLRQKSPFSQHNRLLLEVFYCFGHPSKRWRFIETSFRIDCFASTTRRRFHTDVGPRSWTTASRQFLDPEIAKIFLKFFVGFFGANSDAARADGREPADKNPVKSSYDTLA